MGKWLKWKLVHKDGLTFHQYRKKHKIKTKDGKTYDMSQPKEKYLWYEPVLIQDGYPCVYAHDYCVWSNNSGLYFLDAKEWHVIQKN
jgi:hypothetical protein